MPQRDCLKCGACCLSDRRDAAGYVYVTPEEEDKLRAKHPV